MIKKIKKPLLCLMFTLLFVSLAACAVKFETQQDDFVYNYNEVASVKPDDGYLIDGALTEEAWSGNRYYNLSGEEYSFKLTTHFSDTGLYAAVVIEDGIYYRQSNNFTTNTSFSLKFKVADKGSIFTYSADLVNARRSTGAAMKSRLQGKTNSDRATLTFEMYTTWQSMGIGEKPSQILALPTYHRIQNEFDTVGKDLAPVFSQNMKTSLYLDFDADGFCQADDKNAVLGDSGYGVTKSGGWDVSREAEGVVKSYKKDYQAIFFKDAFYDSFIMEAKITPVGGISDSDPRLGLMSYIDFNTWKATMLYGKAANLETDNAGGKYFKGDALSSLTFYPDGAWHWTDTAANTAPAGLYADGLTFRMVKVKDLFLYIINGKLKCSEQVSYLGGKTLAGFYALGMEAEFSDFKLESLEGDAEGTAKELQKYGYTLGVSRTPGGTVSSDKVFISAAENSVTLTVSAASGYKFSGLTQNGKDIFDDISASLNADGTFTLSGIDCDTALHFSFSRIDKAEQNIVSGEVTDSAGSVMNGLNVVITDSTDKYNSYRVTTDISGKFSVIVLGGRTYDVSIDGGVNYHKFIGTLTADTSGSTAQAFVLAKKTVGGFAANGLLGIPSAWDLTEEQSGRVKAIGTTNGRPVFFTDFIADNALVKATISYTPVAGGDTNPAAGFAIGDLGAISRIMLMGKGLRILRYGNWGAGDLTDLYDITGSYNFGGSQQSEVTFVMLRRGTSYYLFTESGGQLQYFYTVQLDTVKGAAAFGFVTTSDESRPLDIRYSDYSVSALTGDEADLMISENAVFGLSVTKSEGGELSVTGLSGDKVAGGAQTITVTPDAGNVVTKLTVNGADKPLGTPINGSYSVKHIFTADTNITVEFMLSVGVSGRLWFNAENYSPEWNLSTAVLTFSASGFADIVTTADARGFYSVRLLADTAYEITAAHSNALSASARLTTTSEAAQTAADITLGLGKVNGAYQKPDGSWNNWDLEWTIGANGSMTPPQPGGASSMIRGARGEKFIVEATFTNNGSSDEWAGAGLRFGSGASSFNVFVMKDTLMISNNPWVTWSSANETIHYGAITNLNSNKVTLRVIKNGAVYYVIDASGGQSRLIGKVDDTNTLLNRYSGFVMPDASCYGGVTINSGGGANLGKITAENIKLICDEAVIDAELRTVWLNASYGKPSGGEAPSGDRDWLFDKADNSWSCPDKTASGNGGKTLMADTMAKRYIAEATFTTSDSRLCTVALVFKDNYSDNAAYIGLFGWGMDAYPSFGDMDAGGVGDTSVTITVIKDTYLDGGVEKNVLYVFQNGKYKKTFAAASATVQTLQTLETCFGVAVKGSGHQNVKVSNIGFTTDPTAIDSLKATIPVV